jgi:hypothetical protein
MELTNETPFVAERVVLQDKDGRDVLVAIVKGTYVILTSGVRLAGEQTPIQLADTFHGEPGRSSTALESDLAPRKLGTDVVVLGHAYAPRGRARELDVSLAVGPLRRSLRVYGDRFWTEVMGAAALTSPEPFERMPLVYERAFGGLDATAEDPRHHEREDRNPVGLGLRARRSRGTGEAIRAPNIEDPAQLITSLDDRPEPAGFGFIGRSWQPRAGFAGTYDEAWLKDRSPLPPKDFDDRHYSAAHPRLVSRRHLNGDEPVVLLNASPGGTLRFQLPAVRPHVEVTLGNELCPLEMAFDTLIVHADEERVVMVWRGSRVLGKKDLVRVKRVRIQA